MDRTDDEDDTQLRRVVEATDPSRRAAFPPSTVTPAELRARVETRRAKRRRFWSLLW
jgi:hypothetical protein